MRLRYWSGCDLFRSRFPPCRRYRRRQSQPKLDLLNSAAPRDWTSHPRHGRQFQVELCEKSMPATTEGIKRYLGSGLIRGVGKVMAERIVDRFGVETLDVIDTEPERLQSVIGIGKKRVEGITKAWAEQRAIRDVMMFLQEHGISTALAIKIYKRYGDESLAIVQNTPYRLVQDVSGIGFITADKIARALGLAHDDPNRIEALLGNEEPVVVFDHGCLEMII